MILSVAIVGGQNLNLMWF